MKKIWLLKITVFLAAFLLFQIELVISKILLPRFGGSYLVWGAALVFFQAILLLAYLYSHFVIAKYGISRYKRFHLVLILLTLLFFPGKSLPVITSIGHLPLVVNIFWQLLISIGPSFFVLSTTSIIFQAWLAESPLPGRANPYALYAVSNFGSFLGLLSYPFFFEMIFDINQQLYIWRILYFILIALHFIVIKFIQTGNIKEEATTPSLVIGFKEKLIWFLLGMAGVIMFLSVTNIITYEIAPMPLLWVIPLCIYLFSFVLNFKNNPWCPRWISDKFYPMVSYSIILFFFTQKRIMPFMLAVICHFFLLFAICMFCQSELNKRKPRSNVHLTTFFILISSGGFAGSFLVSWIIPLVSATMLEYLLGLFILSFALFLEAKDKGASFYGVRLLIYALSLIILWPMVFKLYNFFAVIALILIFRFIFNAFKTRPLIFTSCVLAISIAAPFIDDVWSSRRYIYTQRNYYGIYKIYEENEKRFLINGTTLHGAQYLLKSKEKEPLTYYYYSTPVGKIIKSYLFNFNNIGVVGLGTGALAAYGKVVQNIDFFELDPDVFNIATNYFSYYNNCPSKKDCIFGDARLSLNKKADNYYDLLIVDAFSGDSIPVHLLTTEAIEEYLRCLSDKGLILFHISNRYLDLEPVLFSNAKALNLYVCSDSNYASFYDDANSSRWVALTRDLQVFQKLTLQLKWRQAPAVKRTRSFRPWTDKYSNVLSVLIFENLFSQIKEFRPFDWSFSLDPEKISQAQYYLMQGSQYFYQTDFDQAIKYYQKATELNPDYKNISYANVANTYYNLGKYDQAIIYYQKALELNPEGDYASYNNLANTYYNLGRYEQAISYYQKALELNSLGEYTSYNNLADAYYNLGRYEQAISCYQKAIELNPNAYNSRVMYSALLQYQKTIVDAQKAVESNPKDIAAYKQLANAYFNLKQYKDAIDSYKKAVALNPDDIEGYRGLALVYESLKEYEQAIDIYRKISQIDPKAAYAYNNIGVIYSSLGKSTEGIPYLEKAVAIDPSYVEVYYNLGIIYSNLEGKREKAVENLQRAKELFKDKGNEEMVKRIQNIIDKL